MLAESDKAIFIGEHIHQHAGEYFPDLPREPTVQLRERKLFSSEIFFYDIAAGGTIRQVAVKCPTFYDHTHEGRTEFQKFATFNRLNTTPGVHCPRVLDFIEPMQALVTERIVGRSLGRVVVQGSRPFARSRHEEIGELVRLCGAWLRTYHSLAPIVRAPLNDQYFRYVSQYTSFIAGETEHESRGTNRFPLRPGTLVTIRTAIDRIASAREEIAGWYTHGHSDYGPSNILVTEDGITVLDCPSRRLRPAMEDVAYFVTSIAAIPRVSIARTTYLGYYRDIFMRCYFDGRELDNCERRMLAVCELQARLKLWVNQTATVNRYPDIVARPLAAYLKHVHTKDISATLERLLPLL